MKKLPSLRKKIRLFTLILSPLLFIVSLVSCFGLMMGMENMPLVYDLAEKSPASLPHLLKYSLFRQSPPSGQVLGASIGAIDGKTEILHQYLEWQHSPVADEADTFIAVAEKYDLPWTLLPAICGKESTFGKQIPYNSYNCFGWGIYGSNRKGFANWDEAIETVGKGLRENYFNRGLDTVEKIEYSYTPPSAYGTHHWREGVKFFMWQIENFTNLEKK